MSEWPDSAEDIGLIISHGSRDYRGVTVDGMVELHDLPAKKAGKPYRAGPFPYRGEERGGKAYDINEDGDTTLPVWLWVNDYEDPSNLTLKPSIGWGEPDDDDDEEEWDLHVFIRNGEIDII